LFSEPPINLISGQINRNEVTFDQSAHFPLNQSLSKLEMGEYQFGIRPSHLSLLPKNDDDVELTVQVEVAEISGSETFLHVRNAHLDMVLHLPGVHSYDVDETIKIYIPIHKFYVFGMDQNLIHAPTRDVRG
jgi:glycerol transport system ATP-binding protein